VRTLCGPCITTLRLDVSPSSGSAGTFDIRLGDRLLGTGETPLPSKARVLLGEGIDPNTAFEMRWSRSTELALRERVRPPDPVEAAT
jgi:hypothetical protein